MSRTLLVVVLVLYAGAMAMVYGLTPLNQHPKASPVITPKVEKDQARLPHGMPFGFQVRP